MMVTAYRPATAHQPMSAMCRKRELIWLMRRARKVGMLRDLRCFDEASHDPLFTSARQAG